MNESKAKEILAKLLPFTNYLPTFSFVAVQKSSISSRIKLDDMIPNDLASSIVTLLDETKSCLENSTKQKESESLSSLEIKIFYGHICYLFEKFINDKTKEKYPVIDILEKIIEQYRENWKLIHKNEKLEKHILLFIDRILTHYVTQLPFDQPVNRKKIKEIIKSLHNFIERTRNPLLITEACIVAGCVQKSETLIMNAHKFNTMIDPNNATDYFLRAIAATEYISDETLKNNLYYIAHVNMYSALTICLLANMTVRESTNATKQVKAARKKATSFNEQQLVTQDVANSDIKRILNNPQKAWPYTSSSIQYYKDCKISDAIMYYSKEVKNFNKNPDLEDIDDLYFMGLYSNKKTLKVLLSVIEVYLNYDMSMEAKKIITDPKHYSQLLEHAKQYMQDQIRMLSAKPPISKVDYNDQAPAITALFTSLQKVNTTIHEKALTDSFNVLRGIQKEIQDNETMKKSIEAELIKSKEAAEDLYGQIMAKYKEAETELVQKQEQSLKTNSLPIENENQMIIAIDNLEVSDTKENYSELLLYHQGKKSHYAGQREKNIKDRDLLFANAITCFAAQTSKESCKSHPNYLLLAELHSLMADCNHARAVIAHKLKYYYVASHYKTLAVNTNLIQAKEALSKHRLTTAFRDEPSRSEIDKAIDFQFNFFKEDLKSYYTFLQELLEIRNKGRELAKSKLGDAWYQCKAFPQLSHFTIQRYNLINSLSLVGMAIETLEANNVFELKPKQMQPFWIKDIVATENNSSNYYDEHFPKLS